MVVIPRARWYMGEGGLQSIWLGSFFLKQGMSCEMKPENCHIPSGFNHGLLVFLGMRSTTVIGDNFLFFRLPVQDNSPWHKLGIYSCRYRTAPVVTRVYTYDIIHTKRAFIYPPRESVDSTKSSWGVRLCSTKNGGLHLSVRFIIFQWNPVESTIPGGDKRTHPNAACWMVSWGSALHWYMSYAMQLRIHHSALTIGQKRIHNQHFHPYSDFHACKGNRQTHVVWGLPLWAWTSG